MTIDEIAELIDRYGAQLGQWPEEERARAVAASIKNPEIMKLFQSGLQMERLLSERPMVSAPEGLADRIVAAAHQQEVRTEVRREMRLAAVSVELLADVFKAMPGGKVVYPALFVLGVLAGVLSQLTEPAGNGVTDFVSLLLYYA